MKTPLRYAGGKSKAYKLITKHVPLFPKRPQRIISPFIGGGSLESKWAKELDIPVMGFDIFEALIIFWQELLSNPNGLYEQLIKLKPTAEEYARVKELLMSWEVTQEMLKEWPTDYYKRDSIKIEKTKAAAYYFFNHNLSYGPMYLGWMSKIYQNESRWIKKALEIKNYKNPNLNVEKGSFDQVIPLYKHDFLYLDPPYYLKKDNDNKMFKGIYPNANIDVHHTGFDHEKLRDLLHSHQGPFILSYNNCETIREYYSGFEFHYPEWHYSYALGEQRVGKNKVNNNPKESHEILIIKR